MPTIPSSPSPSLWHIRGDRQLQHRRDRALADVRGLQGIPADQGIHERHPLASNPTFQFCQRWRRDHPFPQRTRAEIQHDHQAFLQRLAESREIYRAWSLWYRAQHSEWFAANEVY